jgi:hypothetical protein
MNDFVYRVENSNGEGMYTGKKFNLNSCPEYQNYRDFDDIDEDHHPLPSWDLLYESNAGGKFGFESITAVYTWLYDEVWIKYLRENGYHIKKYLATDIFRDDERQLVFYVEDGAAPAAQYALSIYGPAAVMVA